MKKHLAIVMVIVVSSLCYSQKSEQNLYQSFDIEVTNPVDIFRPDAMVSIPLNSIKKSHDDFNCQGFLVFCNGKEIASQLFDNGDSNEICFVSDFKSGEKKIFTVKYLQNGKIDHRYKSRTYAEVAMKVNAEYNGKIFVGEKFEYMDKVEVPAFHIDHNALFKYEGPGWESDKVGYRFYIDWRNSVDIFGKKTGEMVLHKVGAKDLNAVDEKYHEMNDWGTDIFKVGNSLGIGTIAMEYEGMIERVSKRDKVICEITANGPVKSEITTDYFGWIVGNNKYDLNSKLSIAAGSRLTKVDLKITNSPDNISTGLAKYEGTEFIKSNSTGEWQYIALYGKQTLINDNLGIALFYKKSTLIDQHEDDLSYIVKMAPSNGYVNYCYAAAWEQEQGGIKSVDEFIVYLNNVIVELNNPLSVSIK